jgi:hypothetical protein
MTSVGLLEPKPVWLLSRFDVDWCWLPNGPWYRALTPYRQTAAGNWDHVIENVKTDLLSELKRFPAGWQIDTRTSLSGGLSIQ